MRSDQLRAILICAYNTMCRCAYKAIRADETNRLNEAAVQVSKSVDSGDIKALYECTQRVPSFTSKETKSVMQEDLEHSQHLKTSLTGGSKTASAMCTMLKS